VLTLGSTFVIRFGFDLEGGISGELDDDELGELVVWKRSNWKGSWEVERCWVFVPYEIFYILWVVSDSFVLSWAAIASEAILEWTEQYKTTTQTRHNVFGTKFMDYALTGCSPNDNWIGFPFCTHFIISSITPSVKVRPKASGNANEGLEGCEGKLPRDSPECGMTREGMLIVGCQRIVEFVEFVGEFASRSGSLPSHDAE
jgi:hypothetical protein